MSLVAVAYGDVPPVEVALVEVAREVALGKVALVELSPDVFPVCVF